jgi:hypothetical protein
LVFSLLLQQGFLLAQDQSSSANISFESFSNTPNSTRPRVWWNLMNGNITTNGIRKDLQWMNRAGIEVVSEKNGQSMHQ